jgi:hypothetical protein
MALFHFLILIKACKNIFLTLGYVIFYVKNVKNLNFSALAEKSKYLNLFNFDFLNKQSIIPFFYFLQSRTINI